MTNKQNRIVSEKRVPQGLYFINRTLQCTDSSSSPAWDDTSYRRLQVPSRAGLGQEGYHLYRMLKHIGSVGAVG
jgi:hypothetical protein